MISHSSKVRQSGFGIVEIMIALMLSLLLATGVIQIYLGSKQSYRMTENLSRLQENARFAADTLAREIRMAGYMPCQRPPNVANVVEGAAGNPLMSFFSGALIGYEGGVSTFPDEFPSVGSASGDRVAGTDAIVILRGGSDTMTVESHQSAGGSANIKVQHLGELEDGDIAMVCDSEQATVFRVTNANESNVTVVHNTGQGSYDPPNCRKGLGGSGACDDACSCSGDDYVFGDDAQVVKYFGHGYFVGVSSQDDSERSLYRIRLNNDTGTGDLNTETEELLTGIETMQVLYGVGGGSGVPDRYMSADDVESGGLWNSVVTVRLGLLARGPDLVRQQDDDRVYNIAGTSVGPSTTVSHDGDRRLRHVFNMTVKLRNRGTM